MSPKKRGRAPETVTEAVLWPFHVHTHTQESEEEGRRGRGQKREEKGVIDKERS